MSNLPETTVNILVSGLMGIVGGLVALPINTIFSWWLKRDEQLYQHKLDMIAKKHELLMQHKLEMEKNSTNSEITELKQVVSQLEQRISNG